MASTVTDNVNTQTLLLSVNLSRKRRRSRARAPLMASGYIYKYMDGIHLAGEQPIT